MITPKITAYILNIPYQRAANICTGRTKPTKTEQAKIDKFNKFIDDLRK